MFKEKNILALFFLLLLRKIGFKSKRSIYAGHVALLCYKDILEE